jgi:hypothetical protein
MLSLAPVRPPIKPSLSPQAGLKAQTRPASRLKERLVALFFIATTISAGYVAWSESLTITDLRAQLAKKAALTAARPAPRAVGSLPPAPPVPDDQPAGPAALVSLMNNPQVQQFVDARIGQMVDNAYADLFQQLNLSQTDADNLRTLLLQRSTAWRDVMNTAAAQGLDPAADRDQLRQMMTDAQGQVDNSIHTLLGDANYQTYQTYNAGVQQNMRGMLGGGGFGGGFGGGGFGGGAGAGAGN